MFSSDFPQISVLIIESDIVIAVAMCYALQNAGYYVCGRVSDESGAIAAYKEHLPDVAIVNLHLKAGCGKNAAKILKDGKVQVVIVSGGIDAAELADVLGAPCLHKPYQGAELLRALEVALSCPVPPPATAVWNS